MFESPSDRMGGAVPLPMSANSLLKQIAGIDREMIERHARLRALDVGTTLFEAGEPLEQVYFPIDTIVTLEQSCGIEVAVAGREGMAGWTGIAGFRNSPYRAVARCRGGHVVTMPLEVLLAMSASNNPLRLILAQYLVVTAVHMAEGLGAHVHHRLEAAIARWLLLRHDRLGGDWIPVQHQEIADGLGARRASVTDCLHILEGERHIRARRGRILVRNRPDLETRANGAYGAAESLYCASLAPFGKSVNGERSAPERRLVSSTGDLNARASS